MSSSWALEKCATGNFHSGLPSTSQTKSKGLNGYLVFHNFVSADTGCQFLFQLLSDVPFLQTPWANGCTKIM